jgi:hypothetical protein
VDTTMNGDIRILTFPSGGVVREFIVAVDEEVRRMAYAVIEGHAPYTPPHTTTLRFKYFLRANRIADLFV